MVTFEEDQVWNENGTGVLVVEDDPAILDFMGTALRETGFHARSARTAEDAIELIDGYKFDLAILDIYLPDGNGLKLAREIKWQDPKFPIIIITGQPATGNLSESVNVNVDAYLIKPVRIEKLLFLVGDLLDRSRDV